MRGQHRRVPIPGAVALGALLLAGACQEPAEPAGLAFARPVLELGVLTSGATETLRFPFRVEGSEAVVIQELKPGCGCLDPRLELDGRRLELGSPLPAGSRGEIVVEYDSAGFQGQKDILLEVLGQGAGLPRALEVRSFLEPWLVVEPSRYTPGELAGQGPWTVDFRVTGPEAFRLLDVAGLPPGVTVDGLPSQRRAQEHAFRLQIPAEAAPGEHAWFLKLRADNALSTVVPFQYRIEEEVWTRPARVVRLGRAPAGSQIQATVDVGTSHGELAVTEYRLEGLPGARVECLNLTPSTTYRLRLAIPTGPEAGVLTGKLHLRLRHEADGEVHNLDRQITLAGVVE